MNKYQRSARSNIVSFTFGLVALISLLIALMVRNG